MPFCCISLEKKNIFTSERVRVFVTRFREFKHFGDYNEWGIDFTLDSKEKEQLIKNYESVNFNYMQIKGTYFVGISTFIT